MITSAKLYKIIKFIALIGLPAVSSLYYGIASLWSIPQTSAVMGTLTLVDTFLGAVLGLSTKPADGILYAGENSMKLHLPLTQEEAASKKTVTLQVKPDTSTMITG